MVMTTQLFDDAGTPVKDKKYEVCGMVASLFPQDTPPIGSFTVEKDQAKEAVAFCREILGACLSEVDIEDALFKQEIAFWGLTVFSVAVAKWQTTKYGGTNYPLIPTAEAFTREIVQSIREKNRGGKYFETASTALNESSQVIISC